MLHTIELMPRGGVKIVDVKPILDHGPNTDGEAAFEDKMGRRFVMATTKGANPPIRPPASLEAVRRPNPVLYDKPREKLAFWWCPSLPNDQLHGRAYGTGELRLVGRRARVCPVRGELPNDRVRHTVLQSDMRGMLPKQGKLMKVLDR
jgi:hypothetical protein